MSVEQEAASVLLSLPLRNEADVVLARQRARRLAAGLGFAAPGQSSVATAVAEIAANAVLHGGGGSVRFEVAPGDAAAGPAGRERLIIHVSDEGRGSEPFAAMLRGETSPGMGIASARRLMDSVTFAASDAGTEVTLIKDLPSNAKKSVPDLHALAEELRQTPFTNPLEEVQHQNRELAHMIDEAKSREEELARVNQELAETNAGVLALYDELETLHRISVTLASKLELKPLIQTIIDVTTVLTNADLGVFFLRDEASDSYITYAKAGARVPAMDEFPASVGNDFFGPDFASAGLAHARDLASSCAEGAVSRFQQALGARLHVRSCLTVPVVDLSDKVLGAMIFVALTPNAFSERSERILTSVATQAVVGIEKARLFQSVTAASDAKDQFLAMLSHELRTPLNPVMAIVSSLCGDPRVPGELAEDLAVVWRNIRLESRLIDDLLDFNRLIKGKMEIVHERLDVHEVIRSVIEICREELQAKGHHLTTDLGAAAHTISGDSGRLQQVLWNVLRNAVKFTPPGGRITVETSADRESLQVAITDTGHGIEEHALENIFRAFEQGTAKAGPQLGGLGLGLSIARMFVALHGGSIQATSGGLGAGACFTITLPLLAAAVPPAPARTPEVARGGGAKTGRILVVDDHEDTLRTLARLLNRRGYEVTMAASGAEAHQQLGAGAFDLLISDLGLPDCSGLDLLRRIRAERPLPAIALSGYGMEADLQNSAAAGFQAHLTKPVDFQELARLVESLLAAE